jgi:hypothetical protein
MIQSDLMTFLYDPLTGGPPRAFECKLPADLKAGVPHEEFWGVYAAQWYPCGFVSRTLSGMRSHQRQVHSFVPQQIIPLKGNEVTEDARH